MGQMMIAGICGGAICKTCSFYLCAKEGMMMMYFFVLSAWYDKVWNNSIAP
jgi:hypothetical protein